MRKDVLTIMLVALIALTMVGAASAADTQNFAVSANVPAASGITFQVTEILANGTWTSNHPASLSFGTLQFDTTNNIFRPTKYFAIDLGVTTGGAGQPDNIQFVYTDGANDPNSVAGNGRGALGQKATLKVVKATAANVDYAVSSLVLLNNVTSIGSLDQSSFLGGWPRAYIGLYDGSDATLNAAGWEVFTPADAPGDYLGVLEITATVN